MSYLSIFKNSGSLTINLDPPKHYQSCFFTISVLRSTILLQCLSSVTTPNILRDPPPHPRSHPSYSFVVFVAGFVIYYITRLRLSFPEKYLALYYNNHYSNPLQLFFCYDISNQKGGLFNP